jgi:hypothetical protein
VRYPQRKTHSRLARHKDACETFKASQHDRPVDQARRRLLTIAAGGAVAAAIPTAALVASPAVDPAFALIAEKRAADVAHGVAIDAQDEAETRYGIGCAEEAFQRCCIACRVVGEADWRLATTPPTTLAGVAAVFRFANEVEDAGGEWPDTDTIGPEGWHYQLRATMAAAVEALLEAQADKDEQ